ncbi:MAG: amino acid adenylation domain-containing protein, partial [bacterium]|nr:amino acid adenylation domain-containing protein [bacterium]
MNKKLVLLMKEFKEEKSYWIEKLTQLPTPTAFTPDLPASTQQEMEKKATCPLEFPAPLTQRILKAAKQNHLSLYIILLAALKVLLFKYTGSDDIITASPMHNKDETQYNDRLLLRDTVNPGKAFSNLLPAVKQTVIEAYKNQHYPQEKILEELNMPMGKETFGKVLLRLENIHRPANGDIVPGAEEIDVSVVNTGDALEGSILYGSHLFRESTVRGIADHFKWTLTWLLSHLKEKLEEVEVMSPREKKRILEELNDTQENYPGTKIVHEYFEAVAVGNPEAPALFCDGLCMDYLTLNSEANRWAWKLRGMGVGPNVLVGLAVETSLETAVGILAILKAGGAYLPIDPAYPAERIDYMLEDSNVDILLTRRSLKCHSLDGNQKKSPSEAETSPRGKSPRLLFFDQQPDNDKHQNPPSQNRSSDNIYVIYTSGSTGKPKGVVVRHCGVANYSLWRIVSYRLDATDVTLQLLSYSFDGFVSNFYSALLSGGPLVLVPDAKKMEMDYVLNTIEEQRVTNTSLVPPMFEMVVYGDSGGRLGGLKFVVLAGEKASPTLVQQINRLYPDIRLINEYGPTETSVTALTNLHMTEDNSGDIGTPIGNVAVNILDKRQKLVPCGVPGEICISGTGVASGYLNNPQMTADRFFLSPFVPGERIYKTGDLGRRLENGNIELMGRMDNQVKIRGFRVELEEIEVRLQQHPSIRAAVVTAGESNSGETYLCAYIVPDKTNNNDLFDVGSLRQYLADSLPDYMVPAYFMDIENIPLTPTGKVDRDALPEPGAKAQSSYAPPTNPMESLLADAWADILGMDKVGIDDNFFQLGGDSIKAIQVASRLNNHGLQLKVSNIFMKGTIRELGKSIDTAHRRIHQGMVEGEVQLTPIQHWFFEKSFSHEFHFNQSVMLYNPSGFDPAEVEKVAAKLAEHHDALRMVYRRDARGLRQYNRGTDGKLFHLEVTDFTHLEHDQCREEILETASRLQAGFDLEGGPLINLGLFKTQTGDHLLLAVHHLVIDGISWRIIFDDFQQAYLCLTEGKEIKFQDKTDSYKYWASRLKEYADSPEALGELEYWKKIEET